MRLFFNSIIVIIFLSFFGYLVFSSNMSFLVSALNTNFFAYFDTQTKALLIFFVGVILWIFASSWF